MTTLPSEKIRGRGRPKDPIPRSKFLEAARTVFAASGFQGASMSAIAREAGVSKATLFHHFSTKEDLYVEVLVGIASEVDAMIGAALVSEGPFAERTDHLTESIVRYLGQSAVPARLLMREFVDRGPFVQSDASAVLDVILQKVESFFAEGVRLGVVPPQNLRQLVGTAVAVHLNWFAARAVAERLAGADPFSEEALDERVAAAKVHLRRLAGIGCS